MYFTTCFVQKCILLLHSKLCEGTFSVKYTLKEFFVDIPTIIAFKTKTKKTSLSKLKLHAAQEFSHFMSSPAETYGTRFFFLLLVYNTIFLCLPFWCWHRNKSRDVLITKSNAGMVLCALMFIASVNSEEVITGTSFNLISIGIPFLKMLKSLVRCVRIRTPFREYVRGARNEWIIV